MAALAAAAGLPTIAVDGTRGPAEILAGVERALGPLPAPAEPGELGRARGWENDVLAANLRSRIAAGDAPDPPPARYPFVCGCGRVGCAEQVELPLAAYEATARVLAHA